jgi:hypothetical protein
MGQWSGSASCALVLSFSGGKQGEDFLSVLVGKTPFLIGTKGSIMLKNEEDGKCHTIGNTSSMISPYKYEEYFTHNGTDELSENVANEI